MCDFARGTEGSWALRTHPRRDPLPAQPRGEPQPGRLYPPRVAAITVNGKVQEHEQLGSLAELVEQLSLEASQIAVERNREIVPRASYAETQLVAGDEIEIVTFVGGG